jgi:hypothetical protein
MVFPTVLLSLKKNLDWTGSSVRIGWQAEADFRLSWRFVWRSRLAGCVVADGACRVSGHRIFIEMRTIVNTIFDK